jgi:hypothetical protein
MYPNRLLAFYRKDRRKHSAAQSDSHLLNVQAEVALSRTLTSSQQLEGPGFFKQLLFNREQLYSDTSRAITSGQEKSIEASSRLAPTPETNCYRQSQTLQTHPLTSSHPGAPSIRSDNMAHTKQTSRKPPAASAARNDKPVPKTSTAKSKMISKPATPRKRSAPAKALDSERAAKAVKTEGTPEIIFIPQKTESSRTAMLSRGAANSPICIGDTDDEEVETRCQAKFRADLLEEPRQRHSPRQPSKHIKHDWNFDFSSTELDSKPDPSADDSDMVLESIEKRDTQELEQLRKQLALAESTAQSKQEEMERRISEMQHEQQNKDIEHEREIADLRKQLQQEKSKTDEMSQEVGHLREELEDSRGLLEQQVALMQEHKASTSLAEASTKQLEILQSKNTELVTELTALKSAPPDAAHQPLPSPVPSISQSTTYSSSPAPPCTEAQKLENIRQTYTKVKRRYDSLHSVCVKLSACTDSWVLGYFGDFGQLLRLLRQALEADGEERREAADQAQRGARGARAGGKG